jgi:uncharacterized protein (TIGR03083 family)
VTADDDVDDGYDVDVTPALVGIAARWFLDVVGAIGPDQWAGPGLGEWTVRELVGHTARALTTITLYLVDGDEADALDVELDDVVEYYRTALADPAIHDAVAKRGREAGEWLAEDPVATCTAEADAALAAIDGASDDAKARTIAGVMWLTDYLDSRLMELVLHTLDICAATGQPIQPPGGPAQRVLDILAAMVSPADRGAVLLALAGRRPLPDGFSAIG